MHLLRWFHVSQLSSEVTKLQVSRDTLLYLRPSNSRSIAVSQCRFSLVTRSCGSLSSGQAHETLWSQSGRRSSKQQYKSRSYSTSNRRTAGIENVAGLQAEFNTGSLRARVRTREPGQMPPAIENGMNEQTSLKKLKPTGYLPIRKVSDLRKVQRRTGFSSSVPKKTTPKPSLTILSEDASRNSNTAPVFDRKSGSITGSSSEPVSHEASSGAERPTEAPKSRIRKAAVGSRTARRSTMGLLAGIQRAPFSQPDAVQNEGSQNRDTDSDKPLLEALFPEEKTRDSSAEKSKRVIPRLPFESIHFPFIQHQVPSQDKKSEPSQEKPPAYDLESREDVVLRFHGTSKYLAESDFRRIIPGGQHIEGWQRDVGNIERSKLSFKRWSAFYVLGG